jgi:transcriptional antiterminator NusG
VHWGQARTWLTLSSERSPLFRRCITDVWASKIVCDQPLTNQSNPVWCALYTRSHGEQLVCDQLTAKGFHLFLPRVGVWAQRAGQRRLVSVPMFPGYLFLRHVIDKASYVEVRKARGLVRILGERWDMPSVIPDAEIEAIQIILQASVPVMPHSYLREGQRVRITQGSLQGVEGIFLKAKPTKGLLVLSVDLLQRSLAVEVDCRVVTAA